MAGIIQDKLAPGAPPEDEQDPSATAPDSTQAAQSPEPDAVAGGPPPDDGSAEPDEDDGAPPAATGGPNKITSKTLEQSMHLTAQQRPQLDRIVTAGMKVMFDPKTHQMMLDEIKKPGPIEQKLGMSIAGLMGLLVKESNNSLPPQLLIPAGIVLLAHASEFLVQAGIPCSDHDIAASIDVFVHTVLTAFKLDPAKVQAVGGGALHPEDPSAAAAPPAPDAGAPPAPAQGGLVQSAMPQGAQ